MDEFSNGYQPDNNYGGVVLQDGDYKAKVIDVVKTQSKAGDPMLEIVIVVPESTIKFKHRIVKNEYFNGNMTKFYDCFKIPRGNFEYNRWVGRVGKVHIAKGKPNEQGKAYMEIAYLIVEPLAPNAIQQAAATSSRENPLPPVAAPAPRPQAQAAPSADDFPDDIPF